MPEYSAPIIPGTSYTIPNFTNYLFTPPSISIPAIPAFTPITIPALPTLWTVQELIGVPSIEDLMIPYVPPEIADYDPALYELREQAIELEYGISIAILELNLVYEAVLENRQTLGTYNTQLATLRGQLDAQRVSLTSLQSTLNSNKASLDSAVTDYQGKVNALNSDAQKLSTAQAALNTAIADYNTHVSLLPPP